jgi:hypothetical protein
MLNTPQGVTDLNRVAHSILIFKDDVETPDNIAYEILGAEADSKAPESRDDGNGQHIHAEFVDGGEQGHGPHHCAARTVSHSRERASLLLTRLRGTRLRRSRFDNTVRDRVQQAVQDDCDEKDTDEVEEIRNCEIGYIG